MLLFMGTPSNLSDLLHFEKQQQTLRSESTKLLHPVSRSKRNYDHSSFVVAAPHLWNKMHLEIREAKSVTIFRKPTNLSIPRPSYDEFLFLLWTSPLNTDFCPQSH